MHISLTSRHVYNQRCKSHTTTQNEIEFTLSPNDFKRLLLAYRLLYKHFQYHVSFKDNHKLFVSVQK